MSDRTHTENIAILASLGVYCKPTKTYDETEVDVLAGHILSMRDAIADYKRTDDPERAYEAMWEINAFRVGARKIGYTLTNPAAGK